MQINPQKLQEKLLWCFLVVLSPDNKISKVAKNWSIRRAKIWPPQIFVYPPSPHFNCCHYRATKFGTVTYHDQSMNFMGSTYPHPRDLAPTEPTFFKRILFLHKKNC